MFVDPEDVPVYMSARSAAAYLGLHRTAISRAYMFDRIRPVAFVDERPLFNKEVLEEYRVKRAEWSEQYPNAHWKKNEGNSEWGRWLRSHGGNRREQ